MTLGGVLVLFLLLALGALAVTTLVVAVRGGRGPADPPASHARVDLSGFPVPPAPRGVLARVPAGARAAARAEGPTEGRAAGRTPARDLSSAPVGRVGVRSA
ncbi:hypothetical protein [Blastococcus sp. URHD0036]|uniref:hypothetical protein n=1 Tax=Blastococcus sp. URHD0036 TaxID=1380356 RepID=UPI000494EB90|nr:hypothetical protein [Blastococcus sp. URHD0036]